MQFQVVSRSLFWSFLSSVNHELLEAGMDAWLSHQLTRGLWVASFAFGLTIGAETLPPANPINAAVPLSAFSLKVENVIRIPDSSSGDDRFARLEQLSYSGEPTSSRLFVIDQRGKMYYFTLGDTEPTLYFNFATNAPNFRTQKLSQSGLRSFAFHPNAFTPGALGSRKLYIAYEIDNPDPESHTSVLAEWTLDNNGAVIPESRRELLTQPQPRSDHNIGKVGFNPNASPGDADHGKLYVAFGDGGEFNAAYGDTALNPNGQDRSNFLGSILRIDPLQDGNNAYTIPIDNPFVGKGSSVKEEIWAYGLRNPHQFCWDTGPDGKMFIVDLGQDNIEEVNLGAAGANYGWPLREGTFNVEEKIPERPMAVDTLPTDHATDPYTYPVAQYDHDPNNDGILDIAAIAGGFVYRGSAAPELIGKYLFANFGSDRHGPIYFVDESQLVQRENFSNLAPLNEGFLAPVQELRLIDAAGQSVTMFDLVKTARAAQGVNNNNNRRTDIRFGNGPDGEIYILTKRDGWVRRLVSTQAPALVANLTIALVGDGSVQIRVFAVPERNCRLEYTDGLEPPKWHLLTDFVTDSLGEYEFADALPGRTNRFYRFTFEATP